MIAEVVLLLAGLIAQARPDRIQLEERLHRRLDVAVHDVVGDNLASLRLLLVRWRIETKPAKTALNVQEATYGTLIL